MRNRPKNEKLFRERAREMRHVPNDAEAAIWRLLRSRNAGGFKFRRQHPLGNYIVDFYCAAVDLVVELDGASHVGQTANDSKRQGWLESQGFAVIRFSNQDVRENVEEVVEAIWRRCVELAEIHSRGG